MHASSTYSSLVVSNVGVSLPPGEGDGRGEFEVKFSTEALSALLAFRRKVPGRCFVELQTRVYSYLIWLTGSLLATSTTLSTVSAT